MKKEKLRKRRERCRKVEMKKEREYKRKKNEKYEE